MLENTWKHVAALDYPYVKVYVLDDGASDETRDLAASFGFNCEFCYLLGRLFIAWGWVGLGLRRCFFWMMEPAMKLGISQLRSGLTVRFGI